MLRSAFASAPDPSAIVTTSDRAGGVGTVDEPVEGRAQVGAAGVLVLAVADQRPPCWARAATVARTAATAASVVS